jgi:chromosome partitioning protein
MHKVGIANQKGGVGKTTTARHLSFTAMERGLRTLVIDLDPQANLTRTMLYRLMMNADETLMRARSVNWDSIQLPAIAPDSSAHLLFMSGQEPRPMSIAPGVDLFAGSDDLIEVLGWPLDCTQHARSALNRLDDQYDICVIDTPPTMSNLLFAGMICADYLLMPCDLDKDATSGLLDLTQKAQIIAENFNPDLELLGVLLNKVNKRRAYDQTERITLRKKWGDAVLDVELQERSATKLAKEHPVWKSPRGDSDRRAAAEMRSVCESLFKRIGL